MTPVEPDDHGLEPSAVRGRQVVVRRASMPLSSPATPLQPRSITCPGASTDGERESGAARRDPAATGTPHPTAAGLPGGPRTPGHSPADVTMPHILIILPLKARHVRWAAYPWGRLALGGRPKVYQSREKFFRRLQFTSVRWNALLEAPRSSAARGGRAAPTGAGVCVSVCGDPDAHGSSSSAPVGPRATIPHSVPAAASRPIAHTIAAPPLHGLRMPHAASSRCSDQRVSQAWCGC
jgi:hypothetical protein